MAPELMFYDGDCGFCHHSVRFVLKADRSGEAFRFAPIGGPTFREALSDAEARGLPDSIVVRRADGAVLVRSAATLHVLRALGGPWKVLAMLVGLVPAGLRDWGYDLFARHRRRLFRAPESSCPALSPELRVRFDP